MVGEQPALVHRPATDSHLRRFARFGDSAYGCRPHQFADFDIINANGALTITTTNGRHATSLCRTLGPVPDLERHLPADWWRTLFNSVYLKTDGDVVENAVATGRELDSILHATGIQLNDRILDLCCGQGRHCLELARRGFRHLTGVDRSWYLIRLARRRAKQEGLSVSFHEADRGRFHASARLRHDGVPAAPDGPFSATAGPRGQDDPGTVH